MKKENGEVYWYGTLIGYRCSKCNEIYLTGSILSDECNKCRKDLPIIKLDIG